MIRQRWDYLAGEHRLGDLGQFLGFCLFMGFWVPDIFLGYSNSINNSFSLAVRLPAGIVILLVAGCTAYMGIRVVFGKNAQKTGVIRKGVFRFVRHPMYFSESLLYTGLIFINFSLAALASMVPIIAFLYYLCRHEEKLLLTSYGDDYRKYMREVGMWFPRLVK